MHKIACHMALYIPQIIRVKKERRKLKAQLGNLACNSNEEDESERNAALLSSVAVDGKWSERETLTETVSNAMARFSKKKKLK